jgi:hypothetical protein
MPYGSFSFNVVAGTDISTNVGFNPLGVIVSNYSPYYIYFPDGLTFCPPWTSSAVFPLAHATQARATWGQDPFGPQVIAVGGAKYTASITFSESPDLALAGGTLINPPTPIGSTVLNYASAATATTTVTVPFPAATASNLLVAAFSYISGGVAGTVAGPAGWTTILASGSASSGYWLGYKVAAGGETSAIWTVAGITNTALVAVVAEYQHFTFGLFQTASAVAATATVTAIANPNLLIGLSAFIAGGSVVGAMSSPTTIVRTSATQNFGGVRGVGVAIGDFAYQSVGGETATFLWVGTTPTYATAAIAAE